MKQLNVIEFCRLVDKRQQLLQNRTRKRFRKQLRQYRRTNCPWHDVEIQLTIPLNEN